MTGAGDAATETFVPIDVHSPFMWLPLEGPEPRGLVVFYRTVEELEVREVQPAGVGRHWTFAAPRQYGFGIVWSAQRLADGRVALVSAEGTADVEEPLTLRLLGDDSAMSVTVLRTARRFDRIATALDRRGRLVVVAAAAGKVDAAVLDPDAPAGVSWERLSERGDQPEVVAVRDGISAAWYERESGTIRLSGGAFRYDVMAGRERTPIALRSIDDDLVVVHGGAARRIPADLRAAALLDAMKKRAAEAARSIETRN